MKVLFIGHYKEQGGWAEASKGYILAMQEAGIDIVCRNVTLTQDHDPGKDILKLEKKSTDNADFCIQHLLPHHLVGTNKFKKNISIVDLESVSIKDLTWFEHLKLVDEVWVPNKSLSDSLKDFKTRIVHHCSDIEKYTKKYQEIDIPEARGCFKFYYIGDWNDRKNIGAIVRSFHSEFDPSENVRLIFKINKFGYDPARLQAEFDRFLQEQKKSLRMYPDNRYIKDIILTERLSEEQLYSIHQYCDCFICPSHGEAWSIPSFDAMAFGNTPICTDFGGPSEFIDKNDLNTGSLIPFNFASCVCSDAAFAEIFTGREYWAQPCELKIREAMRYYYENKDKLACKKVGLTRAMNYSFDKVGKQIKEILNELTNS